MPLTGCVTMGTSVPQFPSAQKRVSMASNSLSSSYIISKTLSSKSTACHISGHRGMLFSLKSFLPDASLPPATVSALPPRRKRMKGEYGPRTASWPLLLRSLEFAETMAHRCSLPQGKRNSGPVPRGETFGFQHWVRDVPPHWGSKSGCPGLLSLQPSPPHTVLPYIIC